jgi:predicted nucleic-acid-binding protein
MRISADTNVLVRAVILDDAKQTRIAQKALAEAELVAVTTVALCEFVWVLSRTYKASAPEIATAIRTLLASANVKADRQMIEAGLAAMDGGGDFADGVIAFQGAALGAEIFTSFDKDAVRRLNNEGVSAALLA